MFYIYGLKDPRNERVKYIGMTAHPKMRLSQHTSNPATWAMQKWVNGLRKKKLKPVMEIMDTTNDKETAERLERDYIGLFKYASDVGGWKLLNSNRFGVPIITSNVVIYAFRCVPCTLWITETGDFNTGVLVTSVNPVTGEPMYFCPQCGKINLREAPMRLTWDEYWQPE